MLVGMLSMISRKTVSDSVVLSHPESKKETECQISEEDKEGTADHEIPN